jgi:hypothetical protein
VGRAFGPALFFLPIETPGLAQATRAYEHRGIEAGATGRKPAALGVKPATLHAPGAAPSQLIVHGTPKRFTTTPNAGDQNVSSSGIWTTPPSASASNT